MSGVNIPACTIEADGVVWVASWDSEGHISYKGMDKNGKEVSPAPSDVIKAARAYGASFGGNQENPEKSVDEKDGKKAEGKPEDALVIETNKDGTLKSANIPEDKWTDKQREFVEKCLRAAVEQGQGHAQNEAAVQGQGRDVGKKTSEQEQRKNAKDGKEGAELSHKDKPSLKEEFNKSLAQGNVMAREVKKDFVRSFKNVYRAGKLIGQGKFRELRDRAALRIHDNIEAMGLLSDNMKKRINDANKRIEERLKIENREQNPSYASRMIGQAVKDVKGMFNRLSGRTGVESVKISKSNGRSNSREGGYGK